MDVGDICNRETVVAHPAMPISEAARVMRDRHVGSLVVVVERLSEQVPIAMLTDRDIVAVVAQELDPHALTVGEAASAELFTVCENDSVTDALKLMRAKGV